MTAWSRHSSTSITTISGDPKPRSMLVTQTAIAKTDPDPNFVPFVTTPCFPSYPSNHGSAGNGAAEVLRRIYGEGGHSITLSNPAVPDIVLQYTTFKQITDDISDARVYGGIHFRTDQVAGEHLGKAIGKAVDKNNLRPMHNDD